MNRLAIFFYLFITAAICHGQSVTGVRNVQGQFIPLDSFPSRKLLIVILPAATDTALTGQLLRFQRRHAQQVNIVGIVASGAASPLNRGGVTYSSLQPAGIWL